MAYEVHPGSWSVGGYQLPDFHLTEAAQSVGNAVNSLWGGYQAYASNSGGSDLIPNATQQMNTSANQISAMTQPTAQTQAIQKQNTPNPPPAGGGGGGGGSTNNNNNIVPPTPTPNDAEVRQVDSAYGDAMDYLNKAEQAVRGFQPQVESNIADTYNSGVQTADIQKAQNERQIGTAQTDTQSRLQNAISAARQALQESLMGGKQRFGSGSNVYKALGEYGTTKFQQASGQARDTAEKTYRSLQEQSQSLNENYTLAINQLKTWQSDQMVKAQREFQDRLQAIDTNRGVAAENRSFQKIQLLQDMRSRADAIKTQAYTFQQQLDLQRAAYGQKISTQIQQFGTNVGTNVNQANTTGANSLASINLSPVRAYGQTSYADPTQTGMVNQRKPYDPYAIA